MSKRNFESDEPSDSKILFSALGWIGVFFVFLFILAVAYLPNRGTTQYEKDTAERMEIRNSVRGQQARLVHAYEWINQQEGVIRIPVERAMKLTVEEMRRAEESTNPGAQP